MTLKVEDRLDISELLALHGHLVDNDELERLDEMFTDDVVYDASSLGHGELHGLAAFRDMALARARAGNGAAGHHVTNIVLTEAGTDRVHARSKGISVGSDGACASVTYEDVIVRGARGWRISRRTVFLHLTSSGAPGTEADG
ncbi:nuclear transport factor 2 family protein [Streptomyces sp. NPDC006435]|uniref:nuclear transport factor 2 family protein n=1 Tax=Streptomyces sp. NPDC006435 TaxID=3154300 RepID=UPI0033A89BE1